MDTPLGDLQRLPREIRDEVYRNVFRGCNLVTHLQPTAELKAVSVLSECVTFGHASKGARSDIAHTLALLGVSKAVYDEVCEMPFAESIFVFELVFPFWSGNDRRAPVASTAVIPYEKMQNVIVSINVNNYKLWKESFQKRRPLVSQQAFPIRVDDRMCELSIDKFMGLGTARKTFRLRLRNCSMKKRSGIYPNTPLPVHLVQQFSKLYSFEQVEIELHCPPESGRTDTTCLPPTDDTDNFHTEEEEEGYFDRAARMAIMEEKSEAFLKAIGRAYETELGVWEFKDRLEGGTPYSKGLVFHPRAHRIQAAKVGGAKAELLGLVFARLVLEGLM